MELYQLATAAEQTTTASGGQKTVNIYFFAYTYQLPWLGLRLQIWESAKEAVLHL